MRSRRRRWCRLSTASPVACPTCRCAVVTERNIMARNLMMHTCADFERAFAEGADVPRTSCGRRWIRPHRRDRRALAAHPSRSTPDVKVTVDQDKCVSSGQCVLNAGDVFDQRDDDGVVSSWPTAHHPTRPRTSVKPLRRVLPWPSTSRNDEKPYVRHLDLHFRRIRGNPGVPDGARRTLPVRAAAPDAGHERGETALPRADLGRQHAVADHGTRGGS